MKSRNTLIGLALLVVLLAACAPGFNEHVHTANAAGEVAGFWRGLWHGIIVPVTFIVSLFNDRVQISERIRYLRQMPEGEELVAHPGVQLRRHVDR